MNKKYLHAYLTLKAANGYDFEVIASTDAVDRQQEIIDQKGWQLDNYLKNPVILWAHDYSCLPIGKALDVSVTADGLIIKGVFASSDANPLAGQVKQLYEEGILNTVSVGFISKERTGNIITKSELLELSFVPVPANPEALTLLSVTKGIDESIIKSIKEVVEEAEEVVEPEVATDPVTPEPEAQPEAVEEKAGRVISGENLKIINNCVESLRTAVSALEQLLQIADGGKTVEVVDEKRSEINPVLVTEITDQIKALQGVLRINDRTQEVALSTINDWLKRHAK